MLAGHPGLQITSCYFAPQAIVLELKQQNSSVSTTASHAASQLAPAGNHQSSAAMPAGNTSSHSKQNHIDDPDWHEYVGDVEDAAQSGGVGVAPDDARPGSVTAGSDSSATADQSWPVLLTESGSAAPSSAVADSRSSASATAGPGPGSARSSQGAVLGHTQALEVYRAGPGAAKAALLNDNHAKMKAVKRQAKELALHINGLKREMDDLKDRAEQLKLERQAKQEEGEEIKASTMTYNTAMTVSHTCMNEWQGALQAAFVMSHLSFQFYMEACLNSRCSLGVGAWARGV